MLVEQDIRVALHKLGGAITAYVNWHDKSQR